MHSYRVEVNGKTYTGMCEEVEIRNNRVYADGILQKPDDEKNAPEKPETRLEHMLSSLFKRK